MRIFKLNVDKTYEILNVCFDNTDQLYDWIDDQCFSIHVEDKCLIGDDIYLWYDDWHTELPKDKLNLLATYIADSKFQIRGFAYLLKIKNKIANNIVVDTWVEDFTEKEFNSILYKLKEIKSSNFILTEKLGYE